MDFEAKSKAAEGMESSRDEKRKKRGEKEIGEEGES